MENTNYWYIYISRKDLRSTRELEIVSKCTKANEEKSHFMAKKTGILVEIPKRVTELLDEELRRKTRVNWGRASRGRK